MTILPVPSKLNQMQPVLL